MVVLMQDAIWGTCCDRYAADMFCHGDVACLHLPGPRMAASVVVSRMCLLRISRIKDTSPGL